MALLRYASLSIVLLLIALHLGCSSVQAHDTGETPHPTRQPTPTSHPAPSNVSFWGGLDYPNRQLDSGPFIQGSWAKVPEGVGIGLEIQSPNGERWPGLSAYNVWWLYGYKGHSARTEALINAGCVLSRSGVKLTSDCLERLANLYSNKSLRGLIEAGQSYEIRLVLTGAFESHTHYSEIHRVTIPFPPKPTPIPRETPTPHCLEPTPSPTATPYSCPVCPLCPLPTPPGPDSMSVDDVFRNNWILAGAYEYDNETKEWRWYTPWRIDNTLLVFKRGVPYYLETFSDGTITTPMGSVQVSCNDDNCLNLIAW